MRIAALLLALAACRDSPSRTADQPVVPSTPDPIGVPDIAAPTPPAKPPPPIAVPELRGAGYAPLTDGAVPVVVTATWIRVDGQPVIQLQDYEVLPGEIQGGAGGTTMPRLESAATRLLAEAKPDRQPLRFALHLDPKAPYSTLKRTIRSLAVGGAKRFELVARARDGALVAAPLAMLDTTAQRRAIPSAKPDDQPVGMVVTITPDKLVVWSLSGLEGTLRQPKQTIESSPTELARLGNTLFLIVKQRYSRARPPESKTIVVMPDGNIRIQAIAEVIDTVRAAPDGFELFPDVQLAGFE